MDKLEEERNTWFLGTYFLRKYFTVYDNSPAAEGKDYNYVGIGACAGHTEHIEITDDEFGDKVVPPDEVIDEKTDSEGGSSVLVVFLILLMLGMGATAVWCYLRKKKERQ